MLYNAAAVYCRMGQWEQAREVLRSASQEKGAGRGGYIEVALESTKVSVSKFISQSKGHETLSDEQFPNSSSLASLLHLCCTAVLHFNLIP